jgi:hypothetical protein
MVLTELQATHNISQYLIKIDFEELDHLVFNLFEYLKLELYGIDPSYLTDCEDNVWRIPKHHKWISKEIKELMEKENK